MAMNSLVKKLHIMLLIVSSSTFLTRDYEASTDGTYGLQTQNIDDRMMSFGDNNHVDAIGFYLISVAENHSLWTITVTDQFGENYIHETISNNTKTPVYFGFLDTENGISSININSGWVGDGVTNYLIDNVSRSSISAVPLPAAVWLFGSGLIGLASFARRKKT